MALFYDQHDKKANSFGNVYSKLQLSFYNEKLRRGASNE